MGSVKNAVGVYIAVVLLAGTIGAVAGVSVPSVIEPLALGAIVLAVGLLIAFVCYEWGTTIYHRWQRIMREEHGWGE